MVYGNELYWTTVHVTGASESPIENFRISTLLYLYGTDFLCNQLTTGSLAYGGRFDLYKSN